MPCTYCYGGSAKNDGTRLDPERYLDIIEQTNNGPNGNINKIIYAGYATDPLNYEHIDDLIEKSINFGQIITSIGIESFKKSQSSSSSNSSSSKVKCVS